MHPSSNFLKISSKVYFTYKCGGWILFPCDAYAAGDHTVRTSALWRIIDLFLKGWVMISCGKTIEIGGRVAPAILWNCLSLFWVICSHNHYPLRNVHFPVFIQCSSQQYHRSQIYDFDMKPQNFHGSCDLVPINGKYRRSGNYDPIEHLRAFPKFLGHHSKEYSWPLNNAGVRGTNPAQSKICLYLHSRPSLPAVLRLWIQPTADCKRSNTCWKKPAYKWTMLKYSSNPCCSRLSCISI